MKSKSFFKIAGSFIRFIEICSIFSRRKVISFMLSLFFEWNNRKSISSIGFFSYIVWIIEVSFIPLLLIFSLPKQEIYQSFIDLKLTCSWSFAANIVFEGKKLPWIFWLKALRGYFENNKHHNKKGKIKRHLENRKKLFWLFLYSHWDS